MTQWRFVGLLLPFILTGARPLPSQAAAAPVVSPDLKSKDAVKRRMAVHAVAETKDPTQAPILVEALGDKDGIVREVAVVGLRDMGWTEAKATIGNLLLHDPEYGVREESAKTLKAFHDPSCVPALLGGMKDPSEMIRVICVEALAESSAPEARAAVLAAAKDRAPEVRRTVMIALAHTADRASVPVLTAALHDTDAAVRANAAQGLSYFAQMNNPKELQNLLNDPDDTVRASAARSLVQQGDASGLATALAMTKSADRTARLIAVDALGYFQDRDAKIRLGEIAANDPDSYLREGAALSLRRMEVKRKS